MKVEVEIISKEIIKPSSPTPHDHHHYKLSFLDQITPDVYNPFVYFYAPNIGEPKFDLLELTHQLKNSLSETLTRYYPLAGRANYVDFYIECNDEGIPFFEAHVKCQMSDVIQNSKPDDLNELIPFELDKLSEISMGVQLNIFECGGLALAVCMSHKISDALSLITFINYWAATASRESPRLAVGQHLASAKLFPPRSTPLFNTRNSIVRNKITKRFELDFSKVEALRTFYNQVTGMETQRSPSRVEALSAFLYGRFLDAIKDDDNIGPDNLYLVFHAVNIRSRLDPPVPDYAFGNYYRTSMAIPNEEILNDEYCCGLVNVVRDEISKIDNEFMKQFQENNEQLEKLKERSKRFASGELISCSFTSLCRMPLYEADFGWGKPIWVASTALTFKNLFVFIDKRDGDGIEVYVHLKHEHMAKLEADKEFLKYVSTTGFQS